MKCPFCKGDLIVQRRENYEILEWENDELPVIRDSYGEGGDFYLVCTVCDSRKLLPEEGVGFILEE